MNTVLQLMLSSRYAMWLGWGPDLLFFYNDAYRAQTLGKKHPWALGRPARQVWAEIWDEIGPRIDQVLATGQGTWDEGLLLFLERNGFPEETYHTFSYSPAFTDSGSIGGLFCVVVEETERVIGERRLRLLRDLATSLYAALTTEDAMRSVETCLESERREFPFSLTYLFEGKGATARLMARSGFSAGQLARDGTELPMFEPNHWPLDDVLTQRQARVVRLQPDADWPGSVWGKPPTDALMLPLTIADDERGGVFIVGLNPYRPLDESTRSFAQLFVGQLSAALANAHSREQERRRTAALAQIDRAKTEFFSNVSHEFRTPLTLILGPIKDALGTPERALVADNLETVHRNALRLLKLVNTLLDFSRIEAGRMQASFGRVDLALLTADLASVFRSAIERAGLRLNVEAPPLDVDVYVDSEMWEKIILNLLSNALKFTFEGEINVTVGTEGSQVLVTVQDTGTGIPAEEVPHLFERFHRVQGARSRTQEGSGIGLALVSELVKLHQGTVEVSSELGQGTTFKLYLPTGSEHLPREHVVSKPGSPLGIDGAAPYVEEALRWLPQPSASAQPTLITSASAKPTGSSRILVADDNTDMREYVARLLGEQWPVEAVGDGHAALESLRREPPALVVSDVMMPRLDGFALLQAIRERPETRTLPVILLSARAGEEATVDGLHAGANDYLVKPFSSADLLARVASQLTMSHMRKVADLERDAQRKTIEDLFFAAPAAIALLHGANLTIDFVNPHGVSLMRGRHASEFVGKPLAEALPELQAHDLGRILHDVMATGESQYGTEIRVPIGDSASGVRRTAIVNSVCVPMRDAAARVAGVAVFAFDVTPQVLARRHAELGARVGRAFVSGQQLTSQLQQCCEALLELGAASAGIWTYDAARQGFDTHAQAGCTRRCAEGPLYTQAELVRRTNSPQLINDLRDDPRVSDQDWVKEHGLRSSCALPLMLGERFLGVMVLFSRDQLAEETLSALTAVASLIALGVDRDNSERFRELFIGILGHDLRNPLNAVSMAAHLLKLGVAPSQQRTVQRIETSAKRMERMISQVLDFTRERSGGGIRLNCTDGDLFAICRQAAEELDTSHNGHRIEFTVSGSAEGRWDEDRMMQVFSNLLGNALTHGSPNAPVKVELEATADVVQCRISNQGPPIPAAVLPSLFDPFRRALHAKSARSQGLGLGLFISRQIVLAHEGSISVHSSANEGTLMSVTLPKRAAGR